LRWPGHEDRVLHRPHVGLYDARQGAGPAGTSVSEIVGSATLGRPLALAAGDGGWGPGPVAAALVGALGGDAIPPQPQRDRALAPAVDAVSNRDLRFAAEPGRHLGDDRVHGVAEHRQTTVAGDQRHPATLRGIGAAAFCGAVERARLPLPFLRPRQEM